MNNNNYIVKGVDFSSSKIKEGSNGGDYKVFQEYLNVLAESYTLSAESMIEVQKVLSHLAPYKSKIRYAYLFLGTSRESQSLNIADPNIHSAVFNTNVVSDIHTNKGVVMDSLTITNDTYFNTEFFENFTLILGTNNANIPNDLSSNQSMNYTYGWDGGGGLNGYLLLRHTGGSGSGMAIGNNTNLSFFTRSNAFSHWDGYGSKVRDDGTITKDVYGVSGKYESEKRINTGVIPRRSNPNVNQHFFGWDRKEFDIKVETLICLEHIPPTECLALGNAVEEFNKYRRENGI